METPHVWQVAPKVEEAAAAPPEKAKPKRLIEKIGKI